jgi:hypothetical protein
MSSAPLTFANGTPPSAWASHVCWLREAPGRRVADQLNQTSGFRRLAPQEHRQFLLLAIRGCVITGRHHSEEKPGLLETGRDIGVEDSAGTKIVCIEENLGPGSGSELPSENAVKVLLETLDPGEIVGMRVADEYISDVVWDVRHRSSGPSGTVSRVSGYVM